MSRKQPPSLNSVDVSKEEGVPKVVRDARFRAGRTLVQKGQASRAIDVFATLLEEARTQFGDDHFETCPAYYEYGNALFRYSNRRRLDQLDAGGGDDNEQQQSTSNDEKKPPPATKSQQDSNDFKNRMREAAASAALRRAANQSAIDKADTMRSNDEKITISNNEIQPTTSPADNIPKTEETTSATICTNTATTIIDPDIISDIQLSLEIMETAWAILDECQQKNHDDLAITYSDWIQVQVPRLLTGIGDVLSSLERHADAADAYSRALGYREEMITSKFITEKDKESVEYLKCRRLIVESNVLIAEELLACPYDQDVITSETKSVLVRSSEGVVDFARGYYDKARDELQETVLLMGQLSASGIAIGDEKEDVCFVATMVMGVGTKLAEIDEQKNDTTPDVGPVSKKIKTEK